MAGMRELIRAHLLGDANIFAMVGSSNNPMQRIYPVFADPETKRERLTGAKYPMIVYGKISGQTENATDGPGVTRHAQYRFDIVAEDSDTAEALGELVLARMNGWTSKGTKPEVTSFMLENEQDGFFEPVDDGEDGLHGVIHEYETWFSY